MPRAGSATSASVGDPAPLARYRDAAVPVLVGIGSDTWPFVKTGGEAVAAALPQAPVEVFPDGSHQTDPALVRATFAAFIRGES